MSKETIIKSIKELYPNGFVHLLVPGHGGIIDGKYVTAPKKMFTFPNGDIVHEGVENRRIVNNVFNIINNMKRNNFKNTPEVIDIVNSQKDISLSLRIDRINALKEDYKKEGKLVLAHEIHGNAGGGTGFEAYTTKKDNFSDIMAEIWLRHQEDQFPNQRNRKHKEKDFYIIRKIHTYGYLAEAYFFDNAADVALNCSVEGIAKNATALVMTMEDLDELVYGKQ